MKKETGRRLSAPMTVLIAGLLLVGSATGGAVAAGMIDGSQIKNNTVTSAKIKDHTLKAADIAKVKWHPLTLSSGWSAFGGNYGPNPRYTKDALGFVHVEGTVNTTTNTSGGVLATLPSGFRPASGAWVVLGSTTGSSDPRLVNAHIAPTGVITLWGAADANFDFVSLDGITFYGG